MRNARLIWVAMLLLTGVVVVLVAALNLGRRDVPHPAGENGEPTDTQNATGTGDTNGSPPSDAAGRLAELLKALRGMAGGELSRRTLDLIAQTVAADGDEMLVKALADDYRRSTDDGEADEERRLALAMALKAVGTEAAAEALLALAMDSVPGQWSNYHLVIAYSGLVSDADGLARVLDSRSETSRAVALQQMRGKRLTVASARAVGGQLASTSWSLWVLASDVLTRDPASETAEVKIDLLLETYPQALERFGKEEPLFKPYGSPRTEREAVIFATISSLEAVWGGKAVLQQRLAEAGEPQATLVAIALARLGETAVRPRLWRIIGESQDGFVRLMAVEAVGRSAVADDAPLLEALAESDPFMRISADGAESYPVREAAREVLKALANPGGRPGA